MEAELSALRDEYLALTVEDKARHPQSDKQLTEVFESLGTEDSKARKKITDFQIRTASRLLIEVISDEKLPFRVMQIRKHIEELPMSNVLAKDFASALDQFRSMDLKERRAAAAELQRVRASASIARINADVFKAKVHNASLFAAFLIVSTLAGIMVTLTYACEVQLALFPFAALFGALGAWISTTSRLRDANPYDLAQVAELDTLNTSSIWISPLFGAIGAILLYGALKTGVIGSSMLPRIDLTSVNGCVPWARDASLTTFRLLTSDKHIGSVFILALISLAAGWSERLVPDMLETVSAKSTKDLRK